MTWYENNGREKDVVVSTRIRLARNLEDYPFEPRLDDASAREIIGKLTGIFDKAHGYEAVDFGKLGETERASWCEKHLVSPEFARKTTPHALLVNDAQEVYIMACEEDHVRIQCVMSGLELEEASRRACEADDLLDSGARVAYSEHLGYLTHCPTNLGTGMRASVMMFLPALTENGQIRSLQSQLAKIGLTIRGMSGEGSAADGCLYQISNQVTLGVSEDETLKKLADVVSGISESERKLRRSVKGDELLAMRDRIKRAFGTLMFAELLSSAELLRLYSDVRLGASLGVVEADPATLDRILIAGMPATLTTAAEKKPTDSMARDALRAETVRRLLTAG